jgi:cell division protein FtsL
MENKRLFSNIPHSNLYNKLQKMNIKARDSKKNKNKKKYKKFKEKILISIFIIIFSFR